MTPAGDGPARPVARVTGWALATSDTSDVASDRYPPLVEGPAQPLPTDWWGLSGYLGNVDWRPQLDDPSGAHIDRARRHRGQQRRGFRRINRSILERGQDGVGADGLHRDDDE